MISIPQRLLHESFITVLLRSPQALFLQKELNTSASNRQSYIAQHVLTCVQEGEQHIRSDNGHQIIVQAGEMAVLRRGLYTVTDLVSKKNAFRANLAFFEEDIFSSLPFTTNISHSSLLRTGLSSKKFPTPLPLTFFWQSLTAWLHSVPNPNTTVQHIKVQEFFALLASSEAISSVFSVIKSERKATQNIRQFMEEHYDKPLSVADYAYLTGRSESSFRREFKTRFGTTPRQWIIRQRLEKAHDLLENTPKDVTQVALEVGYENISHFISEYKKQYGHTPKQRPAITSVQLP
ncbi:MAG: AraC family transcriptional regulator [Bacteroidota bacterium]